MIICWAGMTWGDVDISYNEVGSAHFNRDGQDFGYIVIGQDRFVNFTVCYGVVNQCN